MMQKELNSLQQELELQKIKSFLDKKDLEQDKKNNLYQLFIFLLQKQIIKTSKDAKSLFMIYKNLDIQELKFINDIYHQNNLINFNNNI